MDRVYSFFSFKYLVCVVRLAYLLSGNGISMDWTTQVRCLADTRFSLLHVVQTDSGAHPASYGMGTGFSFPGGKAAAV
jgi:hypothetical protein